MTTEYEKKEGKKKGLLKLKPRGETMYEASRKTKSLNDFFSSSEEKKEGD